MKTQQAASETSAATYKLMDPHWNTVAPGVPKQTPIEILYP